MRRSRLWLVWAVGLCGCALSDAHEVKSYEHPTAGLYTPGSRLGASDPTDFPSKESLGNRCKSFNWQDAGMPTEGALAVEFETRSMEGRFAPKNCTAAWIETTAGDYVATIELKVAIRQEGLYYYQDRGCPEKVGPDVVTGATLTRHGKHSATWKGFDLDGKPVPDGTYQLYIEVTESDREPTSEFVRVDFEKGPQKSGGPIVVDAEGPLAGLSVTWMPGAGE